MKFKTIVSGLFLPWLAQTDSDDWRHPIGSFHTNPIPFIYRMQA